MSVCKCPGWTNRDFDLHDVLGRAFDLGVCVFVCV